MGLGVNHILTRLTKTLGADEDLTKSHAMATSAADTTTVSTIDVPMDATAVILSAKTANARVRLDGTDPTTSIAGLIIIAGAQPVYLPVVPNQGAAAAGVTARTPIKFISDTGTASQLNAVFVQ